MREIKDCTEEVLRRGKMRIRERKQRRNHILMACIPLALCITLFSPLVLPDVITDNPTGGIKAENVPFIDSMEDTGTPKFAGKVAVSGAEISHTYTSQACVEKITGLIHGILSKPETNDETLQDYNTETNDFGDLGNGEKSKGYKITVTKGDGTIAEYKLIGELLIDQSTKVCSRLTEEESAELRDALGIPPGGQH